MNESQKRTADLLQSKGFTLTPDGTHNLERVVEFTEEYKYRGARKTRTHFTVESININEDGTVRGSRRSTTIPNATFSKAKPEEL